MRHAARSLFRRTGGLGLVSLLLAPACKAPESSVGDVLLVASVEVTPPTGTLSPQETLQLVAVPKTAGGLELPSRDVVWSSSAPAIVSVSADGLVQAVSAGGPVIVRATVGSVHGETAIVVNPVPVDHVVVNPPTAAIVVGGTAQLTATAYDVSGNVLTGRAFLWESSAPSLAQVTTNGLVVAQAEGSPVTISATSQGKAGSSIISVSRRPASRLGFLQQPGPAIASQPMVPAIRVAIQDDLLGTVGNATNSVTISLAGNPGGATLSGTTTVAAVNGIATFNNLSLDRTGTGYTLAATSSGLSSITSTPFDVSAGSANRLSFATAPPSLARSGVALSPQPALQLRDGAGNPVLQAGIVITASVASGPGSLGGTITAMTNGSGLATFANLTLSGAAGSYTVAFSAPGISAITSAPILVSAGLPVTLTIETQPASAALNGLPLAQQPAVQLRDLSGNPVSQAGVAVTASIATGNSLGVLGGAAVVTTDANGRASYSNLSLSGPAGGYTLRFSITGASVTSNTVTLGAGSETSLGITTQPSAGTSSGAVFARQPVVQLRDPAGNPVAHAGVAVTASIQTGGGTLGGTTTVTTDAAGAASFSNLSIAGTVGDRTLVFFAPGLVSAVSSAITVTPGAASQVSITTQPSASVPNAATFPQQPVVLVKDGGGNPVSNLVVTAAIASGGGTLGGSPAVTTNASGVASFAGLSITGTAGDRTLSFSVPGGASAISSTVTVTAAAASQLSITTQPSSSAASGAAFAQQPILSVKDASNNPVAGVVVTAAIASGGGILGGTATATTLANGTASFANLSISGTAGPRTLSFSATGLTTVTSSSINITAGTASQLSITTQPSSSAQSGAAFAQQPVLSVKDASNNPVAGVVVTAAIASGGGTLGGTVTATSSATGAASFTNLSITGAAGDRTLSFSATGITPLTSGTITIIGPASQLSITTQPSSSAQSGVTFAQQPAVTVKDAASNLVAGVVVTASIASGGGSLGGTATATTNASGVATFTNLSISGTIGNRTLGFAATGVPSATSNAINVTAGAASQLSITTQPSASANKNTTFAQQPVIQLRDADGNAVSQAGVSVTVSINTGPGGAGLNGTTSVSTTAAGVASFSGLSLDKSGNYTLKFTATGLTQVVSNTINVP